MIHRESLEHGALALVITVLVAAMMLGVSTRSALAESQVGSPGNGAGQANDPRGVAVDEAEDLLYVADRGNNRIDVFDASSGTFIKAFGWGVLNGASELQVCTTVCLPGKEGSGPGQLKQIQGIAVDNASGTPGDIYVFDVGNRRVQKFSPDGKFVWMVGDAVNVTTGGDLCPSAPGDVCGAGTGGSAAGQFNSPAGDTIDVGPGGTIYVGDRVVDSGISKTRVQMYSPSGSYLGYFGGKLLEVAGGAGNTTGLAVDSGGYVYAGTTGEFLTGAVRKYDSSGTELSAFNESFNVSAIAIGPEDHLFVADNSDESQILEYDAAGNVLRVFYGSLEARAVGLAPYPGGQVGDIFATEQASGSGRVLAIDFPGPGPVVHPKPGNSFANPIGNTKATLNAKVNPEGKATTYHFEYISDEDFKAAGETFGTGTVETPEMPLGGAADFKLHVAQAQATGLFPETVYHFRVVATNASGEDIGPTEEFETKEPVEFGPHWTAGVGTASATLHAEVNPLGISSTARFQYTELADTTYADAKEAPTPPADPIDLGDGEAMKEVSAAISGLEEGTTYRYRLVVTNRCKPEPAPLCDFAEMEGTFTTFVTLTAIPDCANNQLRAEGNGLFLPDCRAYEMVSPVDKKSANVEPLFNNLNFPANLDQAALDGESITYSAYKAFADAASAPYTDQYLARRDAVSGWQSEAISPKREGPSLMAFESSQLDRQYKVFSDDLCSGWLIQDARPILAPEGVDDFPGLYRRDNCGPEVGSYEALTTVAPPNLAPRKFIPEPQGVSADGLVAIFTAKDNLTPNAPPQPAACVAETDPSAEPCLRRLYEARAGALEYVCILPDGSPFADACSAGQTSPTEGWKGRANVLSNAISASGSRIFWTAASAGAGPLYVRIGGTDTVEVSASASTRFWAAAADGSTAVYSVSGKLLEFDVDSETETLIAEGFIRYAGASEDASRIYFVSSKLLTGEEENSEGDKAETGKPNMYLYEAGSGIDYIGTLASSDVTGFGAGPVEPQPGARLSRVNEDGQRIVFMSYASLTGYDNKDAVTGEPNMEVFFYDAVEDELLCPSCNPSNARSEGRLLTQKFLTEKRAAARIPVHTSQLYGERLISADGNRLYFNSFEALVSSDVNGEEDVYQWQDSETGDCTTASPTYHEVSGGCVDLISSGKSPQGSEIVDISSDGRDVFFKTYSSLVGQDPGRLDIYDARIGGGFPGPVAPPAICQGGLCQSPAPTPPVPATPATQAEGPGNPSWPKPKPKCPKGKHKVKRGGKVVCVKNKKKKSARKGQSKRTSQTRRAVR